MEHRKVTFHKGFGMGLAADMYIPKDATGKLAAIAVSGPFGAVKGQGPLRPADGGARLRSDGLRPFVHGERDHGRYFGEYAFEKMTGKKCDGKSVTVGNKEILIIPGASHVDLYDDQAGVILYDKLELFFRDNLK